MIRFVQHHQLRARFPLAGARTGWGRGKTSPAIADRYPACPPPEGRSPLSSIGRWQAGRSSRSLVALPRNDAACHFLLPLGAGISPRPAPLFAGDFA